MSDVNLPKEWGNCLVGQVTDVIAGGTPKAGNPDNFTEPPAGIAWLTPADLSGYKQKNISHGKRDLSKAGYDSSSAKLMPKGSILFSSRAPIGYVAVAANKISTNQGFKNFVLPDGIVSSYAYFYFRSIRDLAESLGTGTTFKEISGATAKKLPFILPPLAEQKEIAARLDDLLAQVDSIKTRLDGIPAILKRFRQSTLAAATSGKLTEQWREENGSRFESWEQASIGAVSTVATGKTPKRSEDVYWSNGTVPWLTSAVTGQEFCRSAEQFVTEYAVKACTLKLFKEGTLLLAMYGEGKTRGQVTELKLSATCNQACAAVIVDKKIALRQYVKLCLKANYEETRKVAAGGAQPNLNLNKVREIPISLPDLEEQTKIVRRVEELFAFADQVEQRVNEAQAHVNHLTQSILAKAFRGELTADWRAENPDLITGENSAAALLTRIQAERKKLNPKTKTRKKKLK